MRKTCQINRTAPSPAETALNRDEYSKAEGLLREELGKSPENDAVHEGLVRALIDQGKAVGERGTRFLHPSIAVVRAAERLCVRR